MNLSLVVLAAGMGSRYGGLKQMEPVGPSGEFLVDYAVYDALRAGFNKIVFVIRDDIHKSFHDTIGRRVEQHATVSYVFQKLTDLPEGFTLPQDRRKPWGTGHAVLTAADAVQEPFVAINADDFYGRRAYAELARFFSESKERPNEYAMVGYELKNTLSDHGSVARGICDVSPDGMLKSVVEKTAVERSDNGICSEDGPLTGDEPVSMNIWGFKPSLFDYLRSGFREFLLSSGDEVKAEFFLNTFVNQLIQKGDIGVRVLEADCPWFGMTNPDDKNRVTQSIREQIDRGEYPESLWGSLSASEHGRS